nr:class I SAM-dependent methyltransferase [Aneurinibacillus terranovensis]
MYDHLMADAPYDQWMRFVMQAWRAAGTNPKRVAELGCGTGAFTRFLLEADVDVWGVDLSADMLAVAREKIAVSHPRARVHFIQQDIRQLHLDETMDSVVSFCDTLNYITDEGGIPRVFSRVYEALKTGGTFLFDVHTPYKICDVFGDETFHCVDDEVSYIWESSFDEKKQAVHHELTLFVQQADGLYRRFQETHIQQSYKIGLLARWLKEAGFEIVSITADFTSSPVEEESERAFFVARKTGQLAQG